MMGAESTPEGLWAKMVRELVGSQKRQAAVAVIILLTALGIKFFGHRDQQPQYTTAQVEKGTLISSVTASGRVLATNETSITTAATGMVRRVHVKDGDIVRAGQKIAEISLDQDGRRGSAQAWASYLSAKNALATAKTNLYTLQNQLFVANQKFINDAVARGLTTDDPTYIEENATWLAAEAQYKNQASVINQSQASLTNAWLSYQVTSPTITAPVSGKIGSLTIATGMGLGVASQSEGIQKVAVISSESAPLLSVNIAEVDVRKLLPGQKATVTFDSLSGKTFTGKVVTVDRVGSVTNGVTNYPATIKLDVDVPEILPNMAASVNIIVETKDNALLAPSTAIQTQSGQYMARVLKDGREVYIPVEVGVTSDTQTEILSGLAEGDQVITAAVTKTLQSGNTSPFGGGFGGGVFRVGGNSSGGQRR